MTFKFPTYIIIININFQSLDFFLLSSIFSILSFVNLQLEGGEKWDVAKLNELWQRCFASKCGDTNETSWPVTPTFYEISLRRFLLEWKMQNTRQEHVSVLQCLAEKKNHLLQSRGLRVKWRLNDIRLPSSCNIYLFHDLEHAAVTRLVYCEQLRVESLTATLRESANVTIDSLLGLGKREGRKNRSDNTAYFFPSESNHFPNYVHR